MSVSHEIMASGIMQNPTQFITAIPAALIAGGTAAKAFTVVHQGEMGIQTNRGNPELRDHVAWYIQQAIFDQTEREPSQLPRREFEKRKADLIAQLPEETLSRGIYKIVGPGFYFVHPIFGNITKINVTDRTTPIEDDDSDFESKDGKLLKLKPAFTWFVRSDNDNPYNARFKLNNDKHDKHRELDKELEQTVAWICVSGLGAALRHKDSKDLIDYNANEVTDKTREICRKPLLEYGVELKNVWLKPIARTTGERLAGAIENSQNPVLAGAAAASLMAEDGGKVLKLVPPTSSE